ncbi:MAG: DUF1266 domain-containing protein [Streptomyces sp.]|uniref:DUF1266 domain-containing protein n=1 Tax=Streptomyces sp. TaxID=1931 RepID=UPI003D6B5D92
MAWQAPTDVERALYEAKSRGDWSSYLDVLGNTWLYYAVDRYSFDAVGQRRYDTYWNAQTGSRCRAVFTAGMLPAPVADPVYVRRDLETFASDWPGETTWLAVNPGSPCEAYFPGSMAHRTVWRQHGERAWRSQLRRLRTLSVGGPLHGPVAHGLACGALLCVRNGSLWNALAWHGRGYDAERERLKEHWGVTERSKWQEYQEQLIQGEMSSSGAWEFVLRIRRNLARASEGGAASISRWREVTARVARQGGREAGHEESTDTGWDEDPDDDIGFDAEVERLQDLIGRIMRYESRFRADGLLAEDDVVQSVLAWDYGRASKMARWGLGARFCELWETEQAVVRAGRESQSVYDSWQGFSAGYILGRCLHFDEEKFGDWYADMLAAHRILTTDRASPWLNIPFK